MFLLHTGKQQNSESTSAGTDPNVQGQNKLTCSVDSLTNYSRKQSRRRDADRAETEAGVGSFPNGTQPPRLAFDSPQKWKTTSGSRICPSLRTRPRGATENVKQQLHRCVPSVHRSAESKQENRQLRFRRQCFPGPGAPSDMPDLGSPPWQHSLRTPSETRPHRAHAPKHSLPGAPGATG